MLQITLLVNHPPEIEQNKMLISNKEGNEVEIRCTVHLCLVQKYNGLEHKEHIISKRGNEHTLFLSGIVKGDQLGNYECRAINELKCQQYPTK